MQKALFIIFSSLGIVYLFGAWMNFDVTTFYLKPLLLPVLMIACAASSFSFKKILFIALVFCWIGDILLLFVDKGQMFFISGLVAFLTGHLCYIFLFYKMLKQANESVKFKPKVLLPIIAYLLLFYFIVGSHLGAMLIPVMLYAVVISSMLYMAFCLSFRMPLYNSYWLITGALAFVISDSILAVNKFYSPLPQPGFLIMITYIFAQGAIVVACTIKYRDQSLSIDAAK